MVAVAELRPLAPSWTTRDSEPSLRILGEPGVFELNRAFREWAREDGSTSLAFYTDPDETTKVYVRRTQPGANTVSLQHIINHWELGIYLANYGYEANRELFFEETEEESVLSAQIYEPVDLSRIAGLEAQVTRLQNAIRGCVNRMEPREARTVVEEHTKPGDLDPIGGEA